MCDCELSDLKECNGPGNYSWDFDAYGSQAIVAVHDGMYSEVEPDDPGVECGSINIGKEAIVQCGNMMIPM